MMAIRYIDNKGRRHRWLPIMHVGKGGSPQRGRDWKLADVPAPIPDAPPPVVVMPESSIASAPTLTWYMRLWLWLKRVVGAFKKDAEAEASK